MFLIVVGLNLYIVSKSSSGTLGQSRFAMGTFTLGTAAPTMSVLALVRSGLLESARPIADLEPDCSVGKAFAPATPVLAVTFNTEFSVGGAFIPAMPVLA